VAARLLRVSLTGGIASGKSHCFRRFASAGVHAIDADLLARDVVRVGTPGLTRVVERFGKAVLKADGTLNRSALGELVFADPIARRDLEAIIHPTVSRALDAWFSREDETHQHAEPAQTMGWALADVPLLFEVGLERHFDRVIVAWCLPAQQLERLMHRDGLSLIEALRRINAQMPLENKRARADFVIDTSGTRSETDAQVDALIDRMHAEVESLRR
jgi:dephospho-CoA kinase